MTLWLLNFWRAFKENVFAWVILGGLYLFSVGQLLQPILGWAAKRELSAREVTALVGALILSTGALQFTLKFLPPLKISLPIRIAKHVWFSNTLRSLMTWVLLLVVFVLGSALHRLQMHFLFLLLVQIPIQAHLFQADRWRGFFCVSKGRTASSTLVREFSILHLFFGFIAYLCLLASWPLEDWLRWFIPTLAAVWGASVVVLEGDSGRPFLVNCISLLLGTLCGAFVSINVGFLVFVAWGCVKIPELSKNRFWSVENADQDSLL